MPHQVAVITGAGSGVGRSIALALAKQNWQVALIGRTKSKLDAVAQESPKNLHPHPCDIANEHEVFTTAQKILSSLGPPEVLVNSAGTNIPNRALASVSLQDYRYTLDTNLTGAFLWVKALLPAMRQLGRGTIVNIISDAGLIANAKAGPAYSASKFALTGLTQSINAEERQNNIRACGIFPGDINTPLLDKRPSPPPPEARAKMLQPEDVAACALLAISLPPTAIIEQLLIRPR